MYEIAGNKGKEGRKEGRKKKMGKKFVNNKGKKQK